ncbi:hypothetical protein QUB05_05175 [Microcoleus sp. F10-C6]
MQNFLADRLAGKLTSVAAVDREQKNGINYKAIPPQAAAEVLPQIVKFW